MNPKSVEFLRDYNDWDNRTGLYENRPYAPEPVGLEEAIDWACEQIERMQWIPVGERMPEETDGTVAVLLRDGSILTAWASYWHGASNGFAQFTFPHDEDAECTEQVTHWMPLPPPPGETK